MADESEFWNRENEASDSEEDISDPDDDIQVEENLERSNISSKYEFTEKIKFLEHAEESYYGNKLQDKQVSRAERKAISEILRESCKERILSALNLAQQRLCIPSMDAEEGGVLLEGKCFKKYGKSGKSFYLSQVASTVRWLSTSTTTSTEIMNSCSPSPQIQNEDQISGSNPGESRKRIKLQ